MNVPVPAIPEGYPDSMPSIVTELPPAVVRYLMHEMFRKQLEIHEGVVGLVRSLYAGREIAGLSLAQTYQLPGYGFWPWVVRDTEAFLEQRRARQGGG